MCTHYRSLPNNGLLSQAKTCWRINQQINNRVQHGIDSLWIYTVQSRFHESQCSGFWHSVFAEANTTVSTIYDGLWQTKMTLYAMKVGFFHSPTVSSIGDWFCWNEMTSYARQVSLLHCPAVFRSCSAQSGSGCHVITLTVSTLHGMRLCFNNLMNFTLQKVFIVYEI